MSSPRLTVGISFYNTRETLADLARCIFAQSFTDWELILVDDGSTDGGVEIVNKIDDPRVTVICDGVNKGRSARYNDITRIARGEFITRFDADDLSDPTRFEKQIAFLDSHPEVDVVGTDRFSLASGDMLKGRSIHPTTHEEICRNPVRRGIFLCHPGVMGRKPWFERHPYQENYRISEDTALWLLSWRDSRFANIPEPLLFYREYESYSFGKFYRTQKAGIKIAWEFGRKSGSLLDVTGTVLRRLAKLGIFGVLTVLHLQNFVLASRSCKPTKEDVLLFQDAMKIIRNTHVPGLDQA